MLQDPFYYFLAYFFLQFNYKTKQIISRKSPPPMILENL
jgi:hypothetical protein